MDREKMTNLLKEEYKRNGDLEYCDEAYEVTAERLLDELSGEPHAPLTTGPSPLPIIVCGVLGVIFMVYVLCLFIFG